MVLECDNLLALVLEWVVRHVTVPMPSVTCHNVISLYTLIISKDLTAYNAITLLIARGAVKPSAITGVIALHMQLDSRIIPRI